MGGLWSLKVRTVCFWGSFFSSVKRGLDPSCLTGWPGGLKGTTCTEGRALAAESWKVARGVLGARLLSNSRSPCRRRFPGWKRSELITSAPQAGSAHSEGQAPGASAAVSPVSGGFPGADSYSVRPFWRFPFHWEEVLQGPEEGGGAGAGGGQGGAAEARGAPRPLLPGDPSDGPSSTACNADPTALPTAAPINGSPLGFEPATTVAWPARPATALSPGMPPGGAEGTSWGPDLLRRDADSLCLSVPQFSCDSASWGNRGWWECCIPFPQVRFVLVPGLSGPSSPGAWRQGVGVNVLGDAALRLPLRSAVWPLGGDFYFGLITYVKRSPF